jgi:DNA polymerase I
MAETNKKLFLLDAYALIYRAFFALNKNPRINSKGVNTSAVMGFLNTLYEILKNQKPSHIGVAFDVAAPTLRQQDFSEYKANREKMPEDLRASIPYIKALIEGFNIPIFGVEGYEADDVIGTLSKKAEKAGFITYMMTPDKDFGQLVTENIFVYKPAKFNSPVQIWGPKEVCDRYGISEPVQLIDILGLWGDAADNIPGIPGIGEKTAAELVAKYGSVENLIAHADELKGKQRENVTAFAEQGLLSKMLATINTNVPIEFDEEKLRTEKPDVPKLLALFEELEFKTFSQRFLQDQNKSQNVDTFAAKQNADSGQFDLFSNTEQPEGTMPLPDKETSKSLAHDYILIDDDSKIMELVAFLSTQPKFVFDTETTGIDAYSSDLVGVSFSVEAHKAWYLPMPVDYESCKQKVAMLKPLFENEDMLKIGQNLKYDISILRHYDVAVKGKLFDTMIAHYLLEPDQRHNMDYLAEAYLNYTPIPIEDLIGKGRVQRSMRDVPVEQVKEYAAEDADVTFRLYEVFLPMLKETGMEKLFYDIEMPLVPVLSQMEANGVKIDSNNLHQISESFGTEIHNIENAIYEASGMQFNIGSPKQLGEVLFEHLKIKTGAKKTKTGQYATGEEVLQKLAREHPVINMILDYRSLAKLKSTYLDALPTLVNRRDGLIHTSYNQAVASTGRLSSNNPNLQNIPVRTEQGREIRKAFVPRNEQYTLLAADYSQIELRIIAHLSGDKVMVDDFNKGHDIHSATAAKVFHTPLEEVSKEQRRKAKMVNFGIIYGISAFGLAERLDIPRSEASEIIKSYFTEYEGIKEYMNKSIAFAREHGYAETMLGRRRYLRDINASNSVVRGFAERNAINAPIQGSSADMIKIAMIAIHKELLLHEMQSKMILQVHDELVFDAHLDEIELLKTIVKDKMVHALPLSVPVLVELNTGDNWLEAH